MLPATVMLPGVPPKLFGITSLTTVVDVLAPLNVNDWAAVWLKLMALIDAAGVDSPSVRVPAMLLTIDRPVVPSKIGPVRLRLKVWATVLAAPRLPVMLMMLETVRSAPNGTRAGGVAEVLVTVTVLLPNGPVTPAELTPSWTLPRPLAPIVVAP